MKAPFIRQPPLQAVPYSEGSKNRASTAWLTAVLSKPPGELHYLLRHVAWLQHPLLDHFAWRSKSESAYMPDARSSKSCFCRGHSSHKQGGGEWQYTLANVRAEVTVAISVASIHLNNALKKVLDSNLHQKQSRHEP
jgi:hypothetical protein